MLPGVFQHVYDEMLSKLLVKYEAMQEIVAGIRKMFLGSVPKKPEIIGRAWSSS